MCPIRVALLRMNKRTQDFLLLTLLSLIAFWAHNTVLSPDIMESRNLVSAREMAVDGHWLVPTLNGALRLEKPPLPTWLTALTWRIRPDSLALQRGMAGLAGWLLVVSMYRSVLLLRGRRAALFSALVLLTCYQVVLMGRTASWDIYCHAFTMAALPFILRGLQGAHPWRNWLTAGFLVGLSFMSKGPISLYALLLPFLLSLCIDRKVIGVTSREREELGDRQAWSKNQWLSLAAGVLLCVVVSAWWYIAVHLLRPEAVEAVVAKESGNWTSYNTRPWWYYWRFFLEAGVWAPLVLWALIEPLAARFSAKFASRRGLWLPWWWTVLAVVLLSLFPEKKMRYLLPVMMPMAMLAGTWLAAEEGRWRGRLIAIVAGVFFMAEVLLLPWGYQRFFGNPQRRSLTLLRNDERIEGLPFLCEETPAPRPEIMWAAGRLLHPADLTCADTIAAHLPCVVLTHEPPAQALPIDLWQQADSLCLGRFDDNNRPPIYKRRYRPYFIHYATLLTPKP